MTTTNADGEPHMAAMGPVVNRQLTSWLLRPFQSSTTFTNLQRNPTCVFHVVDDVLTVVRTVLGIAQDLEFKQQASRDWILQSCCHWYRLRVISWDTSAPRSEATAEVVEHGVIRPFWGWNRATHVIIEATILVTRMHLIDRKEIEEEFSRLQNAVSKTAGDRETQAWQLLTQHFHKALSD